jgi:hypothetical protein
MYIPNKCKQDVQNCKKQRTSLYYLQENTILSIITVVQVTSGKIPFWTDLVCKADLDEKTSYE